MVVFVVGVNVLEPYLIRTQLENRTRFHSIRVENGKLLHTDYFYLSTRDVENMV